MSCRCGLYSLAALFCHAVQACGAPVIPATLQPGEHYYLAFVSKDASAATSAAITTYNQFVQAEAAQDPALTGTSAGVDWHAVASTASTTALANLGLSPSVPVFLLDGTTQVSVTDASGWVGASLAHGIDQDQFASTFPASGIPYAWTGTNSSGTTAGVLPLGDTSGVSALGIIGSASSQWVNFGDTFSTQPLSLYAISSMLTLVPGDVTRDGIVNGQDIALIASHWLNTGTAVPGDANNDGIVNGQDIGVMASHWLQMTAGGAGGATAVPEPCALILAALAGLVLPASHCRRRR